MTKLMKKVKTSEEGFTLIELIIVIAILAIISAVAIPNILNAVDNSRKTTDVTNARMIAEAAAIVRAKYDDYAAVDLSSESVTQPSSTSDSDDAYMDAIIDELSDNAPTPKYQGAGSATYFQLTVVSSTGEITVTVNNTATDELYPDVSSNYDNN